LNRVFEEFILLIFGQDIKSLQGYQHPLSGS
jgi:hypothetical protein